MLVQKGNDPIIVFAFSRKECEQYASQLTKLDLCNETKKALVTQVFNSTMDALSPGDTVLGQNIKNNGQPFVFK
jgi:ATP-dependent RNA helicase DOB1|tara:strand:- start:270 stop:491 length:222 start_codon:yes stop_codon:yes gene_type:complete